MKRCALRRLEFDPTCSGSKSALPQAGSCQQRNITATRLHNHWFLDCFYPVQINGASRVPDQIDIGKSSLNDEIRRVSDFYASD
jgi:hypothetical protein